MSQQLRNGHYDLKYGVIVYQASCELPIQVIIGLSQISTPSPTHFSIFSLGQKDSTMDPQPHFRFFVANIEKLLLLTPSWILSFCNQENK